MLRRINIHSFSERVILLRIKPKEFRQWNEGMVRKYDPDAFHHHPNPVVRFIEKKRVRTIIKLTRTREDQRIIEVGCGGGNVIANLSVGRLFGFDISGHILSKAKKNLRGAVHLFQGDVQNLSCKGQIFTHVICSEVLEHLLNPSAALDEIARILVHRGKAVISVPNELGINRIKKLLLQLGIFEWFVNRHRGYSQMPEKMEDEWHLHTYSLGAWLILFKEVFQGDTRQENSIRLAPAKICRFPRKVAIESSCGNAARDFTTNETDRNSPSGYAEAEEEAASCAPFLPSCRIRFEILSL